MAKNQGGFAVNERISHHLYGLGTIKEINHLHTTIEFDRDGRKKFVTSLVQLERSDEAAPAAPSRSKRSKKTAAKQARPRKSRAKASK